MAVEVVEVTVVENVLDVIKFYQISQSFSLRTMFYYNLSVEISQLKLKH